VRSKEFHRKVCSARILLLSGGKNDLTCKEKKKNTSMNRLKRGGERGGPLQNAPDEKTKKTVLSG